MSVAAAAGATTPIVATTTKSCIDLKIKLDFKISLEIQLTIIAGRTTVPKQRGGRFDRPIPIAPRH
jgi:hypothetical protein